MALTTVDPTPALIVVDLQRGITAIPCAHPMADVIERSARLAAAFRSRGLPVVLVNVSGGAPGRTEQPPRVGGIPPEQQEIVPELDPQPTDLRITKERWGSFTGTSLHADLQALGVTQVFVTGVATSAGVESTARFAHELGYHVVPVSDAMTDRSLEQHEASVGGIFPRLGEVATTDEVLALL